MRYRSREVDPLEIWSRYCEFPAGTRSTDTFLPKVQCPNPNHDTLKRHFQVNAKDGLVHCFAYCGISGTWAHAVAMIEGLYDKFKVDIEIAERAKHKKPRERTANETEQLRRADRARREADKIILRGAKGVAKYTLPSAKAKKGSPTAITTVQPDSLEYESFLPQVALEYLEKRGITEKSVAAWNLGWLPDERRIAIPARDLEGRLRFLIKRAVRPQDQPKYLYTEGYPKTSILFGACQIDLGMVHSSGLVLVEGSLGTILNHQDGLKNTTAILGTGISEQQRRIIARIRPPRIYLMFDKDSAGIRNIEIAAKALRKYPLYVVRFQKGRDDWDEATREEKERQIARAIPFQKFAHKLGLNVSKARGAISVG